MFTNVGDDLVINAVTRDPWKNVSVDCLAWKKGMERKGLRVNVGKTKIMIDGTGLNLLQSSGKFPCGVCRTGVGSNSIKCYRCNTGCTRSAVSSSV